MDALEFFHLYVVAGISFNQAILRQTKIIGVSVAPIKPHFGAKLDEVLFLIPICFLLIKRLVDLKVLSVWKVARDEKHLVTINRFKQVPCKNCRFFTNNRYLKCAVHPFNALTKQTLNCPDYWLQEHPNSSLPLSIFSATVFDPQTQSWYHLGNLFEHSERVWTVAPFLSPRPAILSSTLVHDAKSKIPLTTATQTKICKQDTAGATDFSSGYDDACTPLNRT